jgi:signal transduction histidine kinase
MRLAFGDKAKLGYAILVLLLAGGLALSIRRLTGVADAQITHVRADEHEITLVERLRWNSELIVSHGRGYLISSDASLLVQVQEAVARFDRNVAALRSGGLSPRGTALVAEVEGAARRFQAMQQTLFSARRASADPERLIQRFDTELRPLRAELERSVDRLVLHKEGALAQMYEENRLARRRLAGRLYGLLGVLVLISVGVAWYFATLLGKSYRQERMALEAARKAVRSRDHLMGLVAHDLRNPLSAITMKAALIKRHATSEKARADADSIQNVAMRMEYLIKSLLDVTTMEAGRFSLTRASCDVDDLMRDTLELFSNVAASKHIRLQVDSSDHSLAIDADRDRVLQVLSNLIGNALKFTPQGVPPGRANPRSAFDTTTRSRMRRGYFRRSAERVRCCS